MTSLDRWLEAEYRYAATAMLRSVSPLEVVKPHPGFGQTMRAVRGAIVASPVPGAYDPDPDYFFHWYRDAAVVIDALRILHADGSIGDEALTHLADFVRFSRGLAALDGRRLVENPGWRDNVADDFVQFLRDDSDLAAVHGEAVAAETRVNADGTLDISRWNRPQYDGPPLRALALLRWTQECALPDALAADIATLIRADMAVTLRHWRDPSYDIWEEDLGLHYYNLRVSAAALATGADWLQAGGDTVLARTCRTQVNALYQALDDFWLEDAGYYRSRILAGRRSPKELDIAVILGAIHAGEPARKRGPHSVHDARMQATLTQLENWFDRHYSINRNRPAQAGVAMGRYPDDVYYSGGAYYFSTLGAAEFCFRAAAGADPTADWIARGDAFLETVRLHTPEDGALSEQFDQRDGRQTSAPHLAWSYAAFISCIAARRQVLPP